MLLACSSADNKQVSLLSPPKDSIIGERLTLDGVDWQGTTDAVLKPKQKIFEQVVTHLKTDENGIATYKGLPFITTRGKVTGDIKNAQIS
jgi:aminoacyl tRNA synthase complex-interacting multifunctional protein 1